jgi:hypothetical protein
MISQKGPWSMSSSAPGGSFGRVFGLHGKGSEGSKEVDEEEVDQQAMDEENEEEQHEDQQESDDGIDLIRQAPKRQKRHKAPPRYFDDYEKN